MISCLRRAGVEVAERHEPVWEGREHKFGARAPGSALRLAGGGGAAAAAAATRTFDAVVVGYPGPPRPAGAHGASPAAGRSSSTRSSRCRTRSSATAGASGRAACRPGRSRRSTGGRSAPPTWSSPTPPPRPSSSARSARGASRSASSAPRSASSSPGWAPPDEFTALFVGKLIPLHGLETILAAARLAPELRFRVVGSGQLDRLLDDRPPNVEHVPWVEYEQLPGELHRASCALGIFGTSAKARG